MGRLNFFVDVPWPVDFSRLAKLTAATFRKVYDVTNPGELQNNAFDDAGDSLRFPTLGLKRESS